MEVPKHNCTAINFLGAVALVLLETEVQCFVSNENEKPIKDSKRMKKPLSIYHLKSLLLQRSKTDQARDKLMILIKLKLID